MERCQLATYKFSTMIRATLFATISMSPLLLGGPAAAQDASFGCKVLLCAAAATPSWSGIPYLRAGHAAVVHATRERGRLAHMLARRRIGGRLSPLRSVPCWLESHRRESVQCFGARRRCGDDLRRERERLGMWRADAFADRKLKGMQRRLCRRRRHDHQFSIGRDGVVRRTMRRAPAASHERDALLCRHNNRQRRLPVRLQSPGVRGMSLDSNVSRGNDSLNPERSDDELRFETQQIEFARLDDGEPSANPFAAALGIAGIAAFIALLFLLWPIFASLVRLARYGFDCAIFLFNATHAIRWLGEPAFDPYAKVSIAYDYLH